MGLWLNIKRGKHYVDLYYEGKKICTLKVSDNNRGSTAVLSFDPVSNLIFKVVKEGNSDNIDESIYNREEYNK